MNFEDYKPVMSHIQQSGDGYENLHQAHEDNTEPVHFTNIGSAKSVAKQIYSQIQIIEKSTDYFEEVGVMLFQNGQKFEFSVTQIGYHDPFLVCFFGYMDTDSPIQLVQHISQVNLVLFKMKRTRPNTPKQPIKFGRI